MGTEGGEEVRDSCLGQHLVNLTGNGSIMIAREHDSSIIKLAFLLSLEGVPKWVYSGRLFVVSARTNKRSSLS